MAVICSRGLVCQRGVYDLKAFGGIWSGEEKEESNVRAWKADFIHVDQSYKWPEESVLIAVLPNRFRLLMLLIFLWEISPTWGGRGNFPQIAIDAS